MVLEEEKFDFLLLSILKPFSPVELSFQVSSIDELDCADARKFEGAVGFAAMIGFAADKTKIAEKNHKILNGLSHVSIDTGF